VSRDIIIHCDGNHFTLLRPLSQTFVSHGTHSCLSSADPDSLAYDNRYVMTYFAMGRAFVLTISYTFFAGFIFPAFDLRIFGSGRANTLRPSLQMLLYRGLRQSA
jgi:hypothetical protein